MNLLYLDCSTGVSGDMLLASLAHALEELQGVGAGFLFLERELQRLGLEGFELRWSEKSVVCIKTHHVEVVQTHEHSLRHYSDLYKSIEESGLDAQAARRALQALRLLGEAEAKVHGVNLESVHFHEIGAVDTLVGICGAMVLLEALKIEKVVASPVDIGSGFVHCAHGILPVPAPTCAELIRGLTIFGSACGMERATPTGLAILRVVVDAFGSLPLGCVKAVGYGSGGRSSEEQPTYVRAFILESLEDNMSNHEHFHA